MKKIITIKYLLYVLVLILFQCKPKETISPVKEDRIEIYKHLTFIFDGKINYCDYDSLNNFRDSLEFGYSFEKEFDIDGDNVNDIKIIHDTKSVAPDGTIWTNWRYTNLLLAMPLDNDIVLAGLEDEIIFISSSWNNQLSGSKYCFANCQWNGPPHLQDTQYQFYVKSSNNNYYGWCTVTTNSNDQFWISESKLYDPDYYEVVELGK